MLITKSNISGTLRRYLLLKIISKAAPSREDLSSVFELTSTKIVEALRAQTVSFFLIEEGQIAHKHVYFSPALWDSDPKGEATFRDVQNKLLSTRVPLKSGVVGKVISTGQAEFFQTAETEDDPVKAISRAFGLEVKSMLTVPLRTNVVIGAVQIINKESEEGAVSDFSPADLELLTEVAEYAAALIQRILDPKFQLSPEDTARFIARFTDTKLISSPEEIEVDKRLVESVGEAIIRREGIFPYKRLSPSSVSALMTNPLDYAKREGFHQATDMQVDEVFVVSAPLLEALIKNSFKDKSLLGNSTGIDLTDVTKLLNIDQEIDTSNLESDETEGNEGSAPIIQLANRVIEDAYISGASDIHIEPKEHDLLIRYRIDGVLQEKLRLPVGVAKPLVTRLKIMCNLDIAERRLPQDGRIVFKKYTRKNIDVDLRVATGPINFGEKVVMRLLDKQRSTLPLTALGFSQANLEIYRKAISQPNGMVLHCGPTGSGKSMTLYSALAEVSSPEVNIQTAEDPIEYTLAGINQMQMNRMIGLTFARALRAFLRMDPDVILVGEMRDQETAEIAIEAAMTGHLLLSTLHANDAPSTIARLVDMHVEPFLVSSTLIAVCSQRLIRRLCMTCRQQVDPGSRERELLEAALGWSGPIFQAAQGGCHMCGGVGYKGRIGIHEIMMNNEEIVAAVSRSVDTAEIKRIAIKSGMKTIHQDALLKVKEGVTSLEEATVIAPPDLR
jgi:type IV pilus assembly protein PilB